MQAEQRTDPLAFHGEGPVWSPSWGGLRWLDMFAGDILSLDGDTVHRRHVGSMVVTVRPRRVGGAVLALQRGFALEDADGTITELGDLWSDPLLRLNEGGCDPDGRFYCGSMAFDQKHGAGSLRRLDPDGSVDVVLTGLTISNGLDWSPDGSLAYYNDTATGRVAVFDYSAETGLTGQRSFAEIPAESGFPDGLTVDSQGGVWVALYGGSAVHRYTPDGRLDGVVEVAASRVTACTFGGPNLDELFITTSREGLDEGEEALAGSLFRVDAGVTGQPVREFAG
ncbi:MULTISPECIES: SMP-30/gluconolactonase/LRE family protein [unclassified Cryobacterium]|uniref:SMP-30/gluconolactonase/LRE family protein n=1 Tax=unclassified Cryobacterium TaxID=2649013 RepID=UPI002AB44A5F|nr:MULTISPECIES: SMP-30/gluconolactonase/LRE family protein [unclassified Cryobacterium]MDY7543928.1 SMP-30/gluconolactonase/LRE family protein [Cryobacterium sp. 5B3]MEA9997659.1 SMP-30/gluconolactonase/LRE family protein [Cryobacterium sp. RTS3]MEB0264515.1 SMP-30/gluconolactonase/LRE family protein [Cryobacterium sp. 10I5]MEB0273640.1 SMP-30/gluconolactonase/LRE family protein [Cryobacterium sp. 5B3]